MCAAESQWTAYGRDDIARIEYVADVLDNDLNEIEKPTEA